MYSQSKFVHLPVDLLAEILLRSAPLELVQIVDYIIFECQTPALDFVAIQLYFLMSRLSVIHLNLVFQTIVEIFDGLARSAFKDGKVIRYDGPTKAHASEYCLRHLQVPWQALFAVWGLALRQSDD